MAKAIPLNEATFVVVDIETTGSIPGKHAITEIAAVKVHNGQVIDRFVSLVDPGQDIPPFIQQLTGITPAMVAGAPTIDAVLPEFCDFLGDHVFVAHHVPFDFKFLNTITRQLLGEELKNPQLCTCRLARKLLPNLRRKNLDSVCQHFDIAIENRHRALGDAEATAQVLLEFLEMLQTDGLSTLGRVLEYFQRGGKRYGNLKVPFPEHRVADFPQRPGVYLMRDEKGEILYIGKAKNLKKRLQSYFNNLYRQPHKVQELMQQVFDIETRILGSELEALLEEAHLIKQHQPYYNRQIKNYKSFPFLKISLQEEFPVLAVAEDIENDQALYFGPYQRKRHLASVVEVLNKVFQLRNCSMSMFRRHHKLGAPCIAYQVGTCSGPCVGEISQYHYREQIQEVVSFLEGNVSQLTERMIAQREVYTERLEFEKAKLIHDRLLELLKLQANTQFLAQAVHQNHLLIVLPDREPERYRILYVYKGRPIFKQVFEPGLDTLESVMERVALLQKMLAVPGQDVDDPIQKAELEEIRIIAQWLRSQSPETEAAIWKLTEPYAAIEKELSRYFSVSSAPMIFGEDRPYAESG